MMTRRYNTNGGRWHYTLTSLVDENFQNSPQDLNKNTLLMDFDEETNTFD